MTMPPNPFGEEDGEEYERHPNPRGPARIPGPRGAADDLDLAGPGYALAADATDHTDAPPAALDPDEPDDLEDLDALDESEYPEYTEITGHPAVPAPAQPDPEPLPVAPPPSHAVLKSLLGAWALAACSAEETQAVEDHLTECAPCAEEALRLRDAVGLLHPEESLDLKPLLRSRVLEDCLGKRPARIPVPVWASPYDTETARLDALLRDFGDSEWHTPVRLKWFEEERRQTRRTTVAGVIGHLLAVDGLVAAALGLDDPLGREAPPGTPAERTERFWEDSPYPTTRRVREPWREQGHTLVRTVSFAGRGVAELDVEYGPFALPLGDAFLERAFECWVHAVDIAEAVDYPYEPPSAPHLNRMIDLAARLLPAALAGRRRAGLAAPPRGLVAAGAPGRTLHLEIEGAGGGGWDIALDSPAAKPSPEHTVARIALDGAEFCQLAAGHISPEEAAVGQNGDREAIRDVLFAAASLSRM
ncbi:maleylpyruvate isomerase N-terminal domain-containing protein [Streptomyces sp. NPDC006487]|uniref:maleylpyruvate isomerase N-terminal domain-containing protein n=1 Tax=Streptomyces sp. NPDC006487 TaxID=3364748 RepID=UPI00368AC4BF